MLRSSAKLINDDNSWSWMAFFLTTWIWLRTTNCSQSFSKNTCGADGKPLSGERWEGTNEGFPLFRLGCTILCNFSSMWFAYCLSCSPFISAQIPNTSPGQLSIWPVIEGKWHFKSILKFSIEIYLAKQMEDMLRKKKQVVLANGEFV